MPKLAKNTNHRQIAHADMIGTDYQSAIAAMIDKQHRFEEAARGSSAFRAVQGRVADNIRLLRNLESMARDNARERIRAAGGAV